MTSTDPPVHQVSTRSAEPEAAAVDERFDVGGLYGLRSTLAAHASRMGAPEGQIDVLLIVASELATNAIRHGGGDGRLRLWHDGDVLICQVIDEGGGIGDPTVGTVAPDPTGPDGGRGLWICRNLAAGLTIDTGPGGRGAVVTAVIAPPEDDGG
jgi:anti-sigma regulatory factor (Ser/Thr protein kinase)